MWVRNKTGGAVNMDNVFALLIVNENNIFHVRAFSKSGACLTTFKSCETEEDARKYVEDLTEKLNGKD